MQACIGMRMSVIELKSFLFTLITNFTFSESSEHSIGKANVYVTPTFSYAAAHARLDTHAVSVLTRPYVAGREREGSMLPLIVCPYIDENKDVGQRSAHHAK